RPKDRLKGVGKDRIFVAAGPFCLAAPKKEGITQRDNPGRVSYRASIHHAGPDLRQVSLGLLRMPPVRPFGDQETEHRITEELQALVRRPAVLGAPRAV
ncbi:uncharacterized protein METZ01_LOCUS375912, partial [marine metagenome]